MLSRKNKQCLSFLFIIAQVRPIQDNYVRKIVYALQPNAEFMKDTHDSLVFASFFHHTDKAQLSVLAHVWSLSFISVHELIFFILPLKLKKAMK
jgi:hypothetical protein